MSIVEMLDELEYQSKYNQEATDMIKEGLQIILDKLKDADKWKNKK